MGLLEYVEKLRGEPEAKRRRITFWLSLALTLVVALLWLTAWHYTQAPAPVATATTTAAQAGNDFWLRIKTGWQTIIK